MTPSDQDVSLIMLICGLASFLREVYLATHTLRIGPPRAEGG
jgi:hypothetical protein